MRPRRLAAVASVAALAGSILLVAAGPLIGNDIWWHLALGEVYATEGPWPAGDPLLHTAHADAPVQHEWLFGVAVHGLERLGGFGALRAVHALAVVAIVLLVGSIFRRASGALEPACLAAAVFAALASWRLIQLRPDLVSIAAAFAVWRLVLEPAAPPSRRRVAACAVLLGVWANLHSLFGVGALLLAAGMAGVLLRLAVLRRLAPGARAERERLRLLRVGAALASGLVLALVNPRGIEQHLTFLRSSAESAIWRVTDEWRPFPLLGFEASHVSLSLLDWLLGMAVLGAFLLAAGLAARRFLGRPSPGRLEELEPVRLALGAASIVAFLVSIRFLWLGAFAMLYALHVWRSRVGAPRAEAPSRGWAAAAVAVALALPLASNHLVVLANLPHRPAEWLASPYAAAKYPGAAVRLLCESGLEGRLFNRYGDGGFLGYWLAPRLRTFVDSRTEHYDAEVLEDYLRVVSRSRRGGDWRAVLDRYGVDVFLGTGYPSPSPGPGMGYTGAHLRADSGWVLVSRGVTHAVWVGRDDRNAANRARAADFWRRHGVPFAEEEGLDASALAGERAAWAAERGLVPGDVPRLLEDRRARDPRRRFRALDRLALVLALLDREDETLRLAREALALRPDAPGPRRRLIYALLRGERPGAAREQIRTWLRDAPGDPLGRRLARQVRAFERVASRSGPRTAQARLDRYPLLSAGEEAWLLADRQRVLVPRESCAGPAPGARRPG